MQNLGCLLAVLCTWQHAGRHWKIQPSENSSRGGAFRKCFLDWFHLYSTFPLCKPSPMWLTLLIKCIPFQVWTHAPVWSGSWFSSGKNHFVWAMNADPRSWNRSKQVIVGPFRNVGLSSLVLQTIFIGWEPQVRLRKFVRAAFWVVSQQN